MKKTIAKLLSTSLALTLVLASAKAAAQPTVKTAEVKTKAPAVVENLKEEKAEEKTGLNLISSFEDTFTEVINVEKAEEKVAVPAVEEEKAAENTEEAVVAVEENVVPVTVADETEYKEIAIPAEASEKTEESSAKILIAPEAQGEKAEIAAPEAQGEKAEIAVPTAQADPVVPEIVSTIAPVAVEAEPKMVWNISASSKDNVVMKFYSDAGNQVNINTTSGTVYINGTGEMEAAIYRYFLSVDKYISAVTELFENYYGIDVELVYPEGITDVLELDYVIKVIALEDGENVNAGEQLYVTNDMREYFNPSDFLEFSPKRVYISEGITNISEAAFAFCVELEEIILPSTIQVIETGAFNYCKGLTKIVIPENAEITPDSFAYCTSLTTVAIAGSDYYNTNGGINMLADDGEDVERPTTNLTAQEVEALIYCF